MTNDGVFMHPLDAIPAAHLRDDHLLEIMRTEMFPRCTTLKTLLAVAVGELAFKAFDELELEACAICCPQGLTSPREFDDLTWPFANASLYTMVSDLQSLKLGHQCGLVIISQVLLCATAAPDGLPSLLRHILKNVLIDGGVALLGALADNSGPLHDFMTAAAPNYIGSRQLRCIISENSDLSIDLVLRHEVPLRVQGTEAMEQLLIMLACLGRAMEQHASLDGIGTDSLPFEALELAQQHAVSSTQKLPNGAVELPAIVDYYIVTKKRPESAQKPEQAESGRQLRERVLAPSSSSEPAASAAQATE